MGAAVMVGARQSSESQAADGIRTTSLQKLAQRTGSATLIDGFDSASYDRTA